jgi:hypothetical protein
MAVSQFRKHGGIRGNSHRRSVVLAARVVSGYYPESESNFSVPAARVLTGEVHDNSGVTVVVPGDALKTLLDSPVLKRVRNTNIETCLKDPKQ